MTSESKQKYPFRVTELAQLMMVVEELGHHALTTNGDIREETLVSPPCELPERPR